jgi:hypothetical protein
VDFRFFLFSIGAEGKETVVEIYGAVVFQAKKRERKKERGGRE